MVTEPETYIGDGVHVSFDGFSLWIWTSNGIIKSDKICLEPDVFAALKGFATRNKMEGCRT
jgi:hypothetical protein